MPRPGGLGGEQLVGRGLWDPGEARSTGLIGKEVGGRKREGTHPRCWGAREQGSLTARGGRSGGQGGGWWGVENSGF